MKTMFTKNQCKNFEPKLYSNITHFTLYSLIPLPLNNNNSNSNNNTDDDNDNDNDNNNTCLSKECE